MNKQTINVDELSSTDEMSISEACLEFMKVEYGVSRNELQSNLNKHPQQRLQSGNALIVKVIGVEEDREDNEMEITAKIDYSNFPYDDPGEILSSLRLKDSNGGSTGSFVNAIELKRNLEPKEQVGITDLKNCPSMVIDELNINKPENGEKPTKGYVKLSARLNHTQRSEFKLKDINTRLNKADSEHEICVGDVYLLDSRLTEWTFDSAHYSLQNPEYSDMHSLIEDLITGSDENESGLFDEERVNEFIEWMENEQSEVLPVNEKQREFIRDCENEISLLQGPPGTGKTSGAIAPSILARVLGKNDGNPCRVLVTGASNKSIDEVMKKTVELATAYEESDLTGNELSNTEFARLTEPPKQGESPIIDTTNKPFTVRHTAFYNNKAGKEHTPVIKDRVTNPEVKSKANNIIVFGTARRTWRLAKDTISDFALENSNTTVTGVVEGDRPHPGEVNEYGLFDVLVADEASMMKMPEFLLTGTFYERGGNILVAGDHRQLPPVEKHEWENDYRPSVTENAPHVSVLDFFRLINGEEIDVIDDDVHELLRVNNSDVTIPLHQLKQTYRCHSAVADFLQKWVYKKLDGIEYKSEITQTMNSVNDKNTELAEILKPESPITVVTYDEKTNQQSNELEAELIRELLHSIPDSHSTGVVTPHNAQRGMIETKLELDAELSRGTDVDTVERFQGGERDVIVVSGTVSDPDYVEKEEEFLLNLNRLNVAMSRMKKKLVVIASRSIFNHVPIDTENYENTLLWKGLAKETGMIRNDGVTIAPKDVINNTGYLSESERKTQFSVHHFDEK